MRTARIALAALFYAGMFVPLYLWADPNGYTQEMFRRAMAEANLGRGDLVTTTSPLYVLVAIKDAQTHHATEVCTLSSFLTGAILKENGLWRNIDGQRKAFDIAMSMKNRVFTFTKPEPRERVKPAYTRAELARVRQLLSGYTRERLLREAQVDLMKSPNEQSDLTRIYRREKAARLWSSDSLRAAVAHVLLEHGILVGEDLESQTLYVPEDWK
jgi:hypothetical protein